MSDGACEMTEMIATGVEDDEQKWRQDFSRWGNDLSQALAPIRALQEEAEFYSEAGGDDEAGADREYPRPEAIRAQVKAANAMLPLIKIVLSEMQNWPAGPTKRTRKPKEATKESKKK